MVIMMMMMMMMMMMILTLIMMMMIMMVMMMLGRMTKKGLSIRTKPRKEELFRDFHPFSFG